LRQAEDPTAQHAADICPQCVPGGVLDLIATATCANCGVEGLERWYTGATWGTTLCEACYQVRVAHGQAQPQSHVSNT
jgi:hypothetical protein